MTKKEERDVCLHTLNKVCLYAKIEHDEKLIKSMKMDLESLVSGVLNSKADIPPYLIQLAKDVKKRHLNENDQSVAN